MRRLRSKKTPLAFVISCAVEEQRFIVARAVEMASCAQPMHANRRAHRLSTGLGKLAKKGYRVVFKFVAGEFPIIPQPLILF